MSNFIPLDRPSDELLLQLVNDRNNIHPPLTLESVTLDPPVMLNPTQVGFYQRNSRTTVNAREGSGYSGSRIVYYDRLDVVQLFGQSEVPVPEEFETAEEALGLLNSSYGLNIEAADLSSLTLSPEGDVVLVTGNSFVYLPNKTITIKGLSELLELERQADELWYFMNYTLPAETGTVD